MSVAWPAFLGAAVLEALVFAVVDPQQLHLAGDGPLASSAVAVYSVAFAVFWAVIAAAGGLTRLLGRDARDINDRGSRR